ncbi:MAG TPA: metal-dependent transcriptional regulator [Aggregatilineales bacterium]|nr:metal-dependent transcriptional regulator [Aggregatilineales bacterium]
MSVTSVMQEYLAETYRIASYQDHAYVSTSELADRMNKTAPAVVRMASRLREAGLIEHEPYQGIRLTEKGEREALYSIRRHRIVEVFLVQVMGLGWHEVHDESDELTAAISDKLLERMDEMVGSPGRCPHGEPIPGRDGVMPIINDVPLVSLTPEHPCTISRVNTHDPEKLLYLQDIKLMPGQDIDLVARAPFNGPLRLRIEHSEQVIGTELATALRVCQRGDFELRMPR